MTGSEEINPSNSIAVIGFTGRFPGGNDTPEKLWESLCAGKDCISHFSVEELEQNGVPASLFNKPGYVAASPVLRDIEYFDAAFFGLTPQEAELMDPQHRILLECCWSALEHAGYDPRNLSCDTGVFAGARTDTYLAGLLKNNIDLLDSVGAFNLGLANDFGFLATRVSHCFNLTGPSYSIQTACSTSLICVHLACQSLLLGECVVALAGGIAINVPHICGYQYQDGSVLSLDGHCRPFDAKARGTVFGSGVGVVVLKSLEKALDDNDCIHAIILGSAVNNDGAQKASFTAPGVQGQVKVIRDALRNSGVTADSISYVEAHGTGTLLGDAIEIRALGRAFGPNRKQPCAIGSIKGNVGHLDAAAGVTGLIKVILSFQHRQLTPSLHFQQANPQIDFERSGFSVNTQLREWSTDGRPRRAGVSAFGVGGTNAHVVLQEGPARGESGESRPWQLLVCSGKTANAEQEAAKQLVQSLGRHPMGKLADVAYTMAVGRHRFGFRRAVTCRDYQQAVEKLLIEDSALRNRGEEDSLGVGFLFPGQDEQTRALGRQLYSSEIVFRQEIDRCVEVVRKQSGIDLLKVVCQNDVNYSQQTAVGDLALFASEYALTRLWDLWGIKPDGLLGHGPGEYVAACVAGVMELEDALHLVSARGRLMEGTERGAMAVVEAGAEELSACLEKDLWLAMVNGPRSCAVSGREAAVERFCEEWQQRKRTVRRLNTSLALHCPLMEPVAEGLVKEVEKISLKPAQMRCVSGGSGNWIGDECTYPEYWGNQLLQTQRFGEGIQTLLQEGWALLEVGPEQFASGIRAQNPGVRLFSSISGGDDQESMLNALGGLWCAGREVSWTGFYDSERRHRIPLPGYPFQRKRFWIDPQPSNRDPRHVSSNPVLSNNQKKLPETDRWFWSPSWHMAARKIGAASYDQRWIVFEDDFGISGEYANWLRKQGASVVSVHRGPHFKQVDEHSYVIAPGAPSDYFEFSRQLLKTGYSPSHILHGWGLTARNKSADSPQFFEDFQADGFHSLIYTAQCIERKWPCSCIVLSNDCLRVESGDVATAAKAGAIALCKVLPQEDADLSAVFVDIDLDSAQQHSDWLWESLVGDLPMAGSSSVVAYRGRHRWVQHFEPRYLDREQTLLRPGGVYLITGGMGSIGNLLAKHLSERFHAKVVLTGRTLREQPIRASEGEILFCQADVADENGMNQVVSQCLTKFGTINGIVHAAGVTYGSSLFRLISETRSQDCITQAHPKLLGLYVIEKLSRRLKLDFVLAMSSNASVLGGIGFLSYAAANCALDVFVNRKSLDGSATRWISANWDQWSDQTRKYEGIRTSMDEFSMTSAEAIEAFERTLALADSGQIIVSTGYLPDRLHLWTRSSQRMRGSMNGSAPSSRSPRPQIRCAFVEPRNEAEVKIAEVWAEVLGLEKIGVNDDFFELGGHSLLVTTLVSKLGEATATEISLKTFFQGPTVAQLAAYAFPSLSTSA